MDIQKKNLHSGIAKKTIGLQINNLVIRDLFSSNLHIQMRVYTSFDISYQH